MILAPNVVFVTRLGAHFAIAHLVPTRFIIVHNLQTQQIQKVIVCQSFQPQFVAPNAYEFPEFEEMVRKLLLVFTEGANDGTRDGGDVLVPKAETRPSDEDEEGCFITAAFQFIAVGVAHHS